MFENIRTWPLVTFLNPACRNYMFSNTTNKHTNFTITNKFEIGRHGHVLAFQPGSPSQLLWPESYRPIATCQHAVKKSCVRTKRVRGLLRTVWNPQVATIFLLDVDLTNGWFDTRREFDYSFFKRQLISNTTSCLNIYICKCFSLYDINNKIDIQFCMNTFDHVISFFSMRMNTISSLQYILYYFHIVY